MGVCRVAAPILEPGLRREEIPSVRHSEDRLSLLPDAAEVPDEVLQRLELLALPLARDHLRGQIAILDAG